MNGEEPESLGFRFCMKFWGTFLIIFGFGAFAVSKIYQKKPGILEFPLKGVLVLFFLCVAAGFLWLTFGHENSGRGHFLLFCGGIWCLHASYALLFSFWKDIY